jgi:hypothetical protein
MVPKTGRCERKVSKFLVRRLNAFVQFFPSFRCKFDDGSVLQLLLLSDE